MLRRRSAHASGSRYGVVFRDLLVLESNIPGWGILLRMLRRLEDRGLVQGVAAGSSAALVESNLLFLKCWIVCGLQGIMSLNGEVSIAGADPGRI